MNLRQLIRSIATTNDELTRFVEPGEITAESEIVLIDLDNDELEPIDKRELIDGWQAREILEGVANLSPELKNPLDEDRLISRFLEYLQNDA